MEKIANDATLDQSSLQKIATYGFATALSTPSAGMPPSAVKEHASKFASGLDRAGKRHADLVKTVRDHISAPA